MGFARSNPRPKKPRMKGVTEIRGPYYSVPSPFAPFWLYEDRADGWLSYGIGYGKAVFG